jgi:hypothetical protein
LGAESLGTDDRTASTGRTGADSWLSAETHCPGSVKYPFWGVKT